MWERIKAHLVEDWKRVHTFLSTQLAALLIALDYGFDYLPQLQNYMPAHWAAYVAAAIIIARVIKQTKAVKQ